MESEQRISEAKKRIRHILSGRSSKFDRVHAEAQEDGVNRLRALEGLCGSCEHLKLGFKEIDRRKRVILYCRRNLNPLILYQNTPLGTQASCESFSKVALSRK